MAVAEKLGNELGLMRRAVRNLARRDLPIGLVNQEALKAAGLGRARMSPRGLIGLLPPGIDPFEKLSERMFKRSAQIERGTTYSAFQDQMFTLLLTDYLDRADQEVTLENLGDLSDKLSAWFGERVSRRTVYVPCVISPWPSPEFSIGPVTFTFLDEFTKAHSDTGSHDFRELHLDSLLTEMRKERAHWMATIEIDGCDVGRASEIANLSVDLAIVALQVAAPNMGVKNMSRLATRRGPGQIVTVQKSNGVYSGGFSNVEPGLSIGQNFMAKIVTDTKLLIDAVGLCVHSFASGNYRLEKLEQAWCDAAYWLHQGLVEAIDTIAVAKFETAIEVLLRAESTSGSQSRMEAALHAFFGLKPDDPITVNSQTTAKQFAKGFVQDRSQVLHGTWSTLKTRLTATREALEYISVTLIRSSAVELVEYTRMPNAKDDTTSFLAWIAERRGRVAVDQVGR